MPRDQERIRLLSDSTDNEREGNNVKSSCCELTLGNIIFGGFCLISGQLMCDFKKNEQSTPAFVFKVIGGVISWLFLLILVFPLNHFSLYFDFYAVIKCPFPNCGFIAGPFIKSIDSHAINTSNFTLGGQSSVSNFTFQDAVIAVATVSGSVSYLIMILVLLVKYSFFHRCIKIMHTETTTKLINPFFNGKGESDDFAPVFLYSRQVLYFYTIFFTNILLYASNVGTLFTIVHMEDDANFPKWEYFDYAGLAAQLVSQYCAIMSCFIFSKVAYAVTIRCHEMLGKYRQIMQVLHVPHSIPENEVPDPPVHPRGRGYSPQQNNHTTVVNVEILDHPLQLQGQEGAGEREKDWSDIRRHFKERETEHPIILRHLEERGNEHAAILRQLEERGRDHAVLLRQLQETGNEHAAFLRQSEERVRNHTLLLERLEATDTEYVKICNESMKPYRIWFSSHWILYAVTAFMSIAYFAETMIMLIYNKQVTNHRISVIYVSLFTLEHVVLFLYPCFRAASILEARKALIHRVSLETWPPDIKSHFLQFMKEQRCGFVLSCLCVQVEFGFNIAYISIFVGFFGIALRVFSLF